MTDYIIGGEILTKRKLVTIDGSMVTTETGIPLALNIILPNVKAAGSDVRLAKLDGTSIAREIECIDVPSTDAVMIHYPFNTTASENSQFYVYWGNASLNEPAANSTYGSEAVWDSDYNMIQLMNTSANSNILDSSSNNINSTSVNNFESEDTVDGNYEKGIIADGINEYYGFGDVLDLNDMNYTIEMKLKGFEWSSDLNMIMSKWYDGSNAEWNFASISDGISGTKLQFTFRNQADESKYLNSNDAFNTTIEHNIQINYDGTTHRLYIDGVLHDSNVATAIRQGNNAELRLFRYVHSTLDYYGAGTIYQTRISQNTYRDGDWAATTHNNLNNPTTTGTDPFYLSRYDDSQIYSVKSDSNGIESTFLRRTSITRNHTGALTDYQQKYTIPYHVLMNTDFSDLRFNTQADGNGDYLEYWIESQTDSDTADVWIKSDYASGDDIIYMFYGNDSLTSESSGSNTFIQWHSVASSGYLDSLLIQTPLIVEGRMTFDSTSATNNFFGEADTSNGDNDAIDININTTFGAARGITYNNGAGTGYNIAGTASLDSIYKMVADGTGVDFYIDGVYKITGSSTLPVGSNMGLFFVKVDADCAMVWSFIRKYTATKPTYTIDITKAPNKFSAVSDSDGNVSIFKRRKPVKLTHSGILTDYQCSETFDYEALMLDNFDDIRFVTQSGEHIPYWIETKTDGVSAKVWFMNDYVDGDTYIWMYYGNEGLSSGSSISDTFEFGDDFSDDLSKWSIGSGVSIVSGELQCIGTGDYNANNLISNTRVNVPSIVEFKQKSSISNSQSLVGFSNSRTWAAGIGRRTALKQASDSKVYFYGENGATGSGISQDISWHDYKVVIVSSTNTSAYRDSVLLGTQTASDTTTTNLGAVIYPITGTFLFDNFRIRKYTAIEPIVTVGAEQHPRTGNIMIL